LTSLKPPACRLVAACKAVAIENTAAIAIERYISDHMSLSSRGSQAADLVARLQVDAICTGLSGIYSGTLESRWRTTPA